MNLKKILAASLFLAIPLAAYSQHSEQNRDASRGPTGIFTVQDGPGLRRGIPIGAETRTEKLASKLMARDISYRVITPVGYSETVNATKRYPVIYLLHGLTGNFANWTDRTKLSEYLGTMNAIIVTPEGENGWYTDGATNANDKYESYIVKELIPEIDKKFRTNADRKNRVIAGLSMGGYGALKFGIKYPEMFSLAGSFSGALGAASYPTSGSANDRMRSLSDIFGPADSDTRKANDIFKMVREITPEKVKALPFLYIDCGTEDFLFQNNRDFVDLLIEKKIPHEFRQLPGGHNWPYWDKQVQEFLRLSERTFAAK